METANNSSTISVGAKLLNSRWIEILNGPDGGDCKVRWTALGMRRCSLLRHVIDDFNLAAKAGAVEKFNRDCHERLAGAETGCEDVERDFWRMCLQELSFGPEADPDSLWTLVQLILTGSQLSADSFTALELAILQWE